MKQSPAQHQDYGRTIAPYCVVRVAYKGKQQYQQRLSSLRTRSQTRATMDSLYSVGRPGPLDLDQLAGALGLFGALDPGRLPLHHCQVIVFIARKGSATYREIEREFDLSNASASRIVNSLSEASPHRKNCLGLVETVPDPGEGRRMLVRLSAKGKAFAKTLSAC